MSRAEKRRLRAGSIALIALVVAYMAFLVLAPLGALVAGVFDEGLLKVGAALVSPEVLGAFWRTVLLGVAAVAVHAVFGTAVAWVLVRHRFPGKHLVNGMIDLPFAISPVVAGYMLLLLFGRRGLLGPLLDTLGIKVAFAMPGMLLATLFVTLPFMIRELMPALEAFGVDQEQAAHTLGASPFTTFRIVTLPALGWAFLYGTVLTFARALGEFGAVLVVGGGVQGHTETATLYIFRALDERQYAGAYGASVVLGLMSLGLVLGAEFTRRKR